MANQVLSGSNTIQRNGFCSSNFRILACLVYCLADHGQTIQSLSKCASCHCIFRLLQTFLPLFSWKMIVNLNNQSGSQYPTEWLLIYFSDEIVRFFYCKTNHRSQQPHKSANKIICAILSACYFALKKPEYVLWLAVNKFRETERRKKIDFFSCYKILYLKMTLRNGSPFWKILECYEWWMMQPVMQ